MQKKASLIKYAIEQLVGVLQLEEWTYCMIKSCGVGEKELERIHKKNFRNEESENRMKWKD